MTNRFKVLIKRHIQYCTSFLPYTINILMLEPNGDVRIEGNSGSDGKGEWSEMVRACVEEG